MFWRHQTGWFFNKLLAFTFDDGYRNFARIARPVLRQYGFPATVFVVPEKVGSVNDWPALYAGALATLVPSLCYEVAPRLVNGSLPQGTAAVVPDRGGIPETIHQTGGGWVYATLDGLADSLAEIDARPEKAREAGERGRQSTWRLSAENHLREYFALLEEVQAKWQETVSTRS